MEQNARLQDFIGTGVLCVPGQNGLGGAVQTIAEADGHPGTDVVAHASAGLERRTPKHWIRGILEEHCH